MKKANYFEEKARREKEQFFGEMRKDSNQYFYFKRVHSDDEIVLITNNIRVVKDSFVLIVDNNKAVFLKSWQVKAVKVLIENDTVRAWAVKLNRNYFKVYTFKSDFEDFSFEKEQNFDDLLEVAKDQDRVNSCVSTHC